MDVTTSNDYYHFVYDPQLYGFNTAYWKELNGAASLTGANKIRVNSLTIASKHQYFHGDFTFFLNVPGAPTGLIRRWGLMDPALGTSQNALYFEQNAGVFQAVVVNDTGTQTTYPITWDSSSWNGVEISYQILWARNTVTFLISGVRVAIFEDRNLTPGYVILPIIVTNQEVDSLDLTYIIGKHIEKVIQPSWELPVVSTTTTAPTQNIESAKESVTVTDVPTVAFAPASNLSESVTVTDVPTVSATRNFSLSDTATITESIGVAVT